jgi:beta-glucanase (GH16 family)
MKYSGIIMVFFFIGITTGCGSDDKEVKLQPANLTIGKVVSTDGSGVVTFEATAENANRYLFIFGDGTNQESADGKISHTYRVSDNYFVQVIAYSKDNLSVDKQIEVQVSVQIDATGYLTPPTYPGLALVWQDEFNGTSLNTTYWTHEIGGSGWGNNELQYYQENNTLVENGMLIIRAKRENVDGRNYTSSRIITLGKYSFKYGRVDIRAKLPKGQGIWPALWMLGANIKTVGWPKCGEIDIMEMIGGTGNDNKVHGTVHWDNGGSHAQYGGSTSLAGGKIFADEFHVFSIVWDESFIKWYLDDVQFHVIDITPEGLSELRQDHFFIFNVAVGGNWPGSPDASTTFPQFMAVDYIRVFQ